MMVQKLQVIAEIKISVSIRLKMNNYFSKLITLTTATLLLSACNEKKSHFENGGDLICTKSHFFSKDTTQVINRYNSTYYIRNYPRGSKEGFYYGDSVLNINNTFFDIDDCKIKD